MRVAGVLAAVLGPIGVGVRRMVVRAVRVMIVRAGVVMPERHALSGGNPGHALNRHGQGQQDHRNESPEDPRHRSAF